MYLEQIQPPRAGKRRKDTDMAIKIGINGFGRIGRVVLRILADDPERFEVCGINLRKADVDYMVYLLKYDSVFRNFPGTVEHAGGDLIVNGRKIKIYSESDAAMINWRTAAQSTSSSPPAPTTPPRRLPATSRAAPRRSS